MLTLTLTHFLVLSALLLGAGILTMALKRNPLGILLGAQLIAAAAALNFIAFNAYKSGPLGSSYRAAGASIAPHVAGQIFALFIILFTALQAALALALFLNLAGLPAPADPSAPPTPV